MRLSISGLWTGHGNWRRSLPVLGVGLLFVGLLNLAGCPKPTYTQMFPGVTLSEVMKITTDQTLTTDQKTQELNALGITDEQVVFFLLNANLPATTQPSA